MEKNTPIKFIRLLQCNIKT